jgi:hypothetical protein
LSALRAAFLSPFSAAADCSFDKQSVSIWHSYARAIHLFRALQPPHDLLPIEEADHVVHDAV